MLCSGALFWEKGEYLRGGGGSWHGRIGDRATLWAEKGTVPLRPADWGLRAESGLASGCGRVTEVCLKELCETGVRARLRLPSGGHGQGVLKTVPHWQSQVLHVESLAPRRQCLLQRLSVCVSVQQRFCPCQGMVQGLVGLHALWPG